MISAFLIVAAVIAADQITKYIIASHAALQNVTVINGFFHITYVQNTGMAWSMLSGQQALLSLVSAAAVGVMIWYLISKKPDRVTTVGIALMIGGAAGNLIDRLFIGAVRDFLDFYIFGYDFPIFNVADSCLCIGVALIIVWSLFCDHRKEEA
jgi:signal peptidase II